MTPTKQDRSASGPVGFSISAGFDNAPIDSQATFRAVMTAFAEPGSIREIPRMRALAPGLSPAMTALVLTLVDFETKVWFDDGAGSQAASYTRFHTGAPVVEAASEAAFAVVTKARSMPRFAAFAQGTLDYPDRSTTIIVEVEHLTENGRYRLRGPGIAGERLAAPFLRDRDSRFEGGRRKKLVGRRADPVDGRSDAADERRRARENDERARFQGHRGLGDSPSPRGVGHGAVCVDDDDAYAGLRTESRSVVGDRERGDVPAVVVVRVRLAGEEPDDEPASRIDAVDEHRYAPSGERRSIST